MLNTLERAVVSIKERTKVGVELLVTSVTSTDVMVVNVLCRRGNCRGPDRNPGASQSAVGTQLYSDVPNKRRQKENRLRVRTGECVVGDRRQSGSLGVEQGRRFEDGPGREQAGRQGLRDRRQADLLEINLRINLNLIYFFFFI